MEADEHLQRVARHFDRNPAGYADVYLNVSSPSAFYFRRRQSIVMRLLRVLDGGLVLDLGCGPGMYAEPCIAQGLRYYGIDIAREAIAEARKRYGQLQQAKFEVSDAKQLPFPSNSVDGVLCLGLLEYVPKEQEPSYVTEMVRVLKPDGIIIFSFLNAASPYWVWADHVPPIVRNIRAVAKNARWVPFKDCNGERIPTRKFRLKERIELLRAAGLSVIEKTYFSLNILPAPLDTRFPGQSFGGKLEHLLQKDIFGWLGMAFVIAARTRGCNEVQYKRQPAD